MNYQYEPYHVAVIGAGHAGCEAALACARLGLKTIMFTVSMDSIALMPCNPNIGGTSKGHLVREIDALGGEMGKVIDKAYIQSKMLNKSKGPAVHSLRVQADKQDYCNEMRRVIENTDNLVIKQTEVTELITSKDGDGRNVIKGIKIFSGGVYPVEAVILCTGVYLKARCIYGEASTFTGPNGLPAANHLTECLINLGIEIFRFKTGTPARIDRRSIDFSKMEIQPGDDNIVPFSFSNTMEDIKKDQAPCWLTYTNEETHAIIRENIGRSPLYSGMIEGTGPRYCPSIEDKVMKFPDKDRHQVFIEPEGNYTNEMYISGMSSSMPEDVQVRMYRSVKGLENAQITRNAYAIEYDCINAMQLKLNLEFKDIDGLFSAGQINGSSGYEEAAAQGLIAGINASMKLLGREPLILDRSQAYIGVLIDDLITKENHEPYRMMTSRAEYRLVLRQDNADLRLTEIGYHIGLINEERYDKLLTKKKMIEDEIVRLNNIIIGTTKFNQDILEKQGSMALRNAASLGDILRRPEMDYDAISDLDMSRKPLAGDVIEQVNIHFKYEGYIERQQQQISQFKKMEKRVIPDNINYDEVPSLRIEARIKLNKIRPLSVGQAGRISGVSPADISVLLVYLEQMKRKEHKSV